MTREEKLDWLYRLRSEIYVYMPKEWLIPMNNALDMAIKELEQEPTTKNDLAVDCIVDVLGSYTDLDIPYKREIAENILSKLPSVTPQPKHGIWQHTNKNEVNVIPEYRCSECGAEYKGFGFDFDYCPRCGCAMEVEE